MLIVVLDMLVGGGGEIGRGVRLAEESSVSEEVGVVVGEDAEIRTTMESSLAEMARWRIS